MLSLTTEVQGAETLEVIFRDLPKAAQAGIRDFVSTVRRLVVGKTPVGETGELKRSWGEVEQTSAGFAFGSDKDYATILEEGHYKNVGPRTVRYRSGIFSRQAPGGMITPVVEDEAVINKALNNITKILIREMRSA